MTYDAMESGLQTGKPVELYEFQHGPTFYRYTSADEPITLDSKLFEPRAISRPAIEATPEIARTGITIAMDDTTPLLDLFRVHPPGDVVLAKIYRMHRGDAESVTIWSGRILSVARNGLKAEVRCESVYTSIKRPELRRLYQRPCPHVLYSGACGISSATYRETKTIIATSGVEITLGEMGAFPDGYFAGGYLELEYETGKFERRGIASHVASVVTLSFPIIGIQNGALVKIYPGCDHTIATCDGKFSNSANYGGFTHIPQKNPFAGTPVY